MSKHTKFSEVVAGVTVGWLQHLNRHPLSLANQIYMNQNSEWLRGRRIQNIRGSRETLESGRTKSRSKSGQPHRYYQSAFGNVNLVNENRCKKHVREQALLLHRHIMTARK
jgi:hypothetical protein